MEELFGMTKCSGCGYAKAATRTFRKDVVDRVLDVGTGACEVVREFQSAGLHPRGVEAVSFPLEDRCHDLLDAGIVEKAALDALPFADHSFDLVTAFNVLEYIPADKLDKVLSEMARVARVRVLISVQLPRPTEPNLGLPDGHHVETLFPQKWWEERLSSYNFASSRKRADMIAHKMGKKGLRDGEGLFSMAREPPEGSQASALGSVTECIPCIYMPLVYHMYSPGANVRAPGSRSKLVFGDVLVVGHACNIVAGMRAKPPSTMKSVIGVEMSDFLVEMNCPELNHEQVVGTWELPGANRPDKPEAEQQNEGLEEMNQGVAVRKFEDFENAISPASSDETSSDQTRGGWDELAEERQKAANQLEEERLEEESKKDTFKSMSSHRDSAQENLDFEDKVREALPLEEHGDESAPAQEPNEEESDAPTEQHRDDEQQHEEEASAAPTEQHHEEESTEQHHDDEQRHEEEEPVASTEQESEDGRRWKLQELTYSEKSIQLAWNTTGSAFLPLDYPDAAFDTVMVMHAFELYDQDALPKAIEEVKRSTKNRIFAVVRTCGSVAIAPGCVAESSPGVRTVQSRQWWIDTFEAHGLRMEWLPHVFESQPCELDDKASKDAKPSRHQPDGKPLVGMYEHKPKGMTWEDARKANKVTYMKKQCPSVFDQLRFAGSHQLSWQDVFPLRLAPDAKGVASLLGLTAEEKEKLEENKPLSHLSAIREYAMKHRRGGSRLNTAGLNTAADDGKEEDAVEANDLSQKPGDTSDTDWEKIVKERLGVRKEVPVSDKELAARKLAKKNKRFALRPEVEEMKLESERTARTYARHGYNIKAMGGGKKPVKGVHLHYEEPRPKVTPVKKSKDPLPHHLDDEAHAAHLEQRRKEAIDNMNADRTRYAKVYTDTKDGPALHTFPSSERPMSIEEFHEHHKITPEEREEMQKAHDEEMERIAKDKAMELPQVGRDKHTGQILDNDHPANKVARAFPEAMPQHWKARSGHADVLAHHDEMRGTNKYGEDPLAAGLARSEGKHEVVIRGTNRKREHKRWFGGNQEPFDGSIDSLEKEFGKLHKTAKSAYDHAAEFPMTQHYGQMKVGAGGRVRDPRSAAEAKKASQAAYGVQQSIGRRGLRGIVDEVFLR